VATLISSALVIGACLLAIGVAVICIEIVAAVMLPGRRLVPSASASGREVVAVLVPAHNEGSELIPTLTDIQSQSAPGDRLLVVADNCTDDTAAVALACGAEVIERHDAAKHGKGYALDYGIRYLMSSDPPNTIIIVDADCRLAEGMIDQLALTCAVSRRPAQALYLMTAPTDSQINHQVAEFAWRVKNWLRPLGLSALRLPCQLMGTGMAFPCRVINSAELGNARLVEDLKLGLDLALAGYPPVFCPSAAITSHFASSRKGAGTQRRRWEQGHVDLIIRAGPRLLATALARRNWELLALVFDMAVPPLSLLVMILITMLGISGGAALLGLSSLAFVVNIASFMTLMFAIFLAWLRCGRDLLPLSALLLTPGYLVGKFNIYSQFLSGKMDSRWTRTDRTKSGVE
jgi:cellulose synthase/poly-beta-1,6-N-acetylglucosamine synthase-like glycosyltransferase